MSGLQYKNASFAVFVTEVMKTREVRNILDSTVSDFFNKWGEKGNIRSEFAKHAKRIIQRRLNQSGDRHKDQELINLLQKTLTSFAGTIDTLHKKNPTILADHLVLILEQFLKHIDLGEIKSLTENSKNDIESLITRVNDLMFEYPAKLILILSFIPEMSNHLLFFLEDLVKRFNALPADILTDLLISFFKEVDEKKAGRLLNNLAEFIRQVHTGSALIGEPGAPSFSMEFTGKTRGILNEINPELFFKAGNALVDGKEALLKSMYDAAKEDPIFLEQALKQMMAVKNSNARVARQKIELLEELNEEEAASAFATAASEWNGYEFAELINSACSMANRVHDTSQDQLKDLVTEFVDTLDLYEIEESVTWISRDLIETFKPVLQTVVPVVVKDLVDCLASENNGNEEQISAMRQTLRWFIMEGETCQ